MTDVLLLLIVLGCVFKLSLAPRWVQWGYAAVMAIGAWWSVRYAVQLSKPAFDALLGSTAVLQDVGIALTLDAMVSLVFCLASPRRRVLSLPFFLLNFSFPLALFYLLAQTVFHAVGVDFQLLAAGFAVGVALLLPLLAEAARWLLPPAGSRTEAHLLLAVVLCVLGLLFTQRTTLVYELSNPNIAMELISKTLFGIANALLIPDILLLIFFFVRAIVLLVGTYTQFVARRAGSSKTLYAKYQAMLREHAPSEAWADYVVAQFEAEAQKEVNLSRLLTKLGPVLGLIGTLISMSPALVGLSTGDIAGMAYNMQVVFSATVVGLFISAIGLFTQQLKSRWYAKDASQLEYEGRERLEGER